MRPVRGIAIIGIVAGVLLLAAPPARPQSAERNTYQRYVLSGMERLKQANYAGAQDAFEDALRYVDDDPVAHLGLGIAGFHRNDDVLAEKELRRALELNPREKAAWMVLGNLAERKDDLDGALRDWEQALAIDPSDGQLKSRVERLKRERRTEQDFNREATGHFSVKYEGREKIEAGRIVLHILEDAYGEIGRALSFYPDRQISVVLYSNRQFREVTDAPGWSNGIYDGKIRVPLGGIERETPGLRMVLYHEYTHAVVHAIAPCVPTWLNEGLAQYLEGRKIGAGERELLKRLASGGNLPALNSLNGPFIGLGPAQASLAYLISLSAVKYIVDTFGMYRIRMVLEELATGAGPSEALHTALLVTTGELEQGWKRSLE